MHLQEGAGSRLVLLALEESVGARGSWLLTLEMQVLGSATPSDLLLAPVGRGYISDSWSSAPLPFCMGHGLGSLCLEFSMTL